MKSVNQIKCIYDITKFSQLDFPDKLSCIVWFVGCNMRCAYCYNPQIVFGKGALSFDDILAFLNKRKNLLDAVVFSGGECTSHKHILEYAQQVKEMGFLLKIDTNGSNPDVIKSLINENLIDYVSLDFKAPSSKMEVVTGVNYFNEFNQTLNALVSGNINFEVRTTVHSELLNQNDLQNMHEHLRLNNYNKNYYLQLAKTNTPTILPLTDNTFSTNQFKGNNIVFRS